MRIRIQEDFLNADPDPQHCWRIRIIFPELDPTFTSDTDTGDWIPDPIQYVPVPVLIRDTNQMLRIRHTLKNRSGCEVTLNPYLTFQVLTAGQRSLGFCLFLPGCQKWWPWLCSSSGGSPAPPQTPGPRTPGPRTPGPRTPGPRTPGSRTPGPRTPGPPGCPPPQTPHVPFTKLKVSIQGIFLNKC